MKHLQWENLWLVAHVFNVSILMGNALFLKAGIQEFSKMIEISYLQVMKSKLTTIL